MILLVRHGVAIARHSWSGPDDKRPLNGRGQRQAARLPDQLKRRPIDRILSSPAVRCLGTIEPLAEARGLKVAKSAPLREGNGRRALQLVLSLAAAPPAGIVLCTHGDVIDEVLAGLADEGWSLPGKLLSAKGSTWVLHKSRGTYLAPPA